MALNNYFNIVNTSGGVLKTIIDSNSITISKNGKQSTGHLFDSGENISVEINGRFINLFLPPGVNSWSTIVYDNLGFINIFPSSPSQQKISY